MSKRTGPDSMPQPLVLEFAFMVTSFGLVSDFELRISNLFQTSTGAAENSEEPF